MDNTILCFDSGIGGLAYLAELRRAAPLINWVYLADNAYFPFGEKPPEQLCERVCQIIGETLKSYPVQTVILLCNTATIWALEELRRRFPHQQFIGTVPAIKPAAAASRRRKIVMLASHTTSKANYVEALHRDFAADCELKAINASKLIQFIEQEWSFQQDQAAATALEPYIEEILAVGADQVVLGCTHFLHLKEQLQRGLQAKDGQISLCDSLEGVRGRLFQVLQAMPDSERGNDILLLTQMIQGGEALRRWEFWAEYFSMLLRKYENFS